MNPGPRSEKAGFHFLGLRFDSLTLDQAIESMERAIETRRRQMVFSPNAQLVVMASEDESIRSVYNDAQLLTVDSHVLCYAARLFGKPVPEPVSTARLMLNLLPIADSKGYKVYLLGASEEVVQEVAARMGREYPGIRVVGRHNGYFSFDDASDVVEDIARARPDLLFVAMSSPLKEKFIASHGARMGVPVSMGVGGAFDIFAGKCQLAPEWISRVGLEWFYRWVQEPRRLWRRYLFTNSKFLWLLAKEPFTRKKKERHARTA